MNHQQAAQEITAIIPEIEIELSDKNSFSIIQALTDQIRKMIRKKEQPLLFRCLKKMDEIYKNEDATLKNAVENIFIYSLDYLTASCNKDYKRMIFCNISPDLQKIYFRQIYKPGM
ncbi:hypothetical protein BAX94_10355 [Elizabethkingia meningoseptica]|uniref:DUF7674 family protein n=1 Tax=Elizabethkingia meningoseptica TaxID=238 RepID=UPI0008AA37B7|nr:hypothetical protein [Elizabethkingia meningoseptica]MDE5449264.1 hypothetical protein [Elizabethkingia meningoseptica]MDE5472223.1 hypothetical protein [Elizabethkingia meningoseptica]MDE5520141.1 hypothetical protein [Elizabethkingia meningoseptica]MDE5523532.1 hypothetical protein [Elizabethkingia meningoseptica]OHT31114.1 hypothetical protein BGC12_07660 [Elizabethkingia meningoseptica]